MSAIVWSYELALPMRTRRRGSLLHITQREHWPPGMLPHAPRQVLCGVQTGGHIGGPPGESSCPACRREFAKILAALPVPGELVTCPHGCSRPSLIPDHDRQAVPCDPGYAGHGEGTYPYATGRFTCPVCRREFNPAR